MSMLLRGGELDGVRLMSSRTLELMTQNHLPDDVDLQEFAVDSYADIDCAGDWLRTRVCGRHGRNQEPQPGLRGLVLLGWRGVDVVLGRSGGRSTVAFSPNWCRPVPIR